MTKSATAAPGLTPTAITRLNAERNASIRALARTDLYALLTLLMSDRPNNQLTEHFHRPMCRAAARTLDPADPIKTHLYLYQRGAFKTTVITAAANVQRILRDPHVRIGLFSGKSENAEAMLGEIKNMLGNPWLIEAFPDVLWTDPERQSETWSKGTIMVKRARARRLKEATVETYGQGSEITSRHYDHCHYDDVVGQQNSQTRELLQGTIDFVRITRSLLDPGGTRAFVGTPWHYADVYAWLEEQALAHGVTLAVHKLPCWVPDPAGEVVPGFGPVRATFPERFPIADLLALRAEKGSAEFAAQYLLDPISADTAFFKREAIQIIRPTDVPSLDDLWVAMSVDPANSSKKWADYSAIAVGGFTMDGKMLLLALERERRNDLSLVRRIFDLAQQFPVRIAGFETTSFAKTYLHLLTREMEARGVWVNIMPLERDTKITKAVRISGLQAPIEAGLISAVSTCRALPEFLHEISTFRHDRESAHDDLMDAVADLFQLRRKPDGQKVERVTRAQFEQEQRTRTPWKDEGTIRMQGDLHAYLDGLDEQRREARVGAGQDEFWS